MRLPSILLSGILLSTACARPHDARTVREVGRTENLIYNLQVDSTRLVRGTGLNPVAAVTRLVEENLAVYFRVSPKGSTTDGERRELVAEAPAPGYALHVTIEGRPDDYCLIAIDVVRLGPDGAMEPVQGAPYSVHYGLAMVRMALSSLRPATRAAMSTARFMELRTQAAALAQRGADPAIDEATFARTPRPLERADDAVRYYAPSESGSAIRR